MKIKLISDGTLTGSKFVDEFGNTVPLIKKVVWSMEAGERQSKITLTRVFVLDQDEEVSHQDLTFEGATAEIAFEIPDAMVRELTSIRRKVKS